MSRNIPTTFHSLCVPNTDNNDPGPPYAPEYQPTNMDVLCGRGKRNWNHAGNVAFRNLIQSTFESYKNAPAKSDKTVIVANLVTQMRDEGIRFINKNPAGLWYDIGDTQARDKVGHSLRDQVTAYNRDVKRAQKELASNQSAAAAATAAVEKQTIESPHHHTQHHQHQQQQRRPSMALSDSGNEADNRRGSLESTAMHVDFARRPSWIAAEFTQEADQRRSANEFRDALADYYDLDTTADVPDAATLVTSNQALEVPHPTPLPEHHVMMQTSVPEESETNMGYETMAIEKQEAAYYAASETMNPLLKQSIMTWDPRSSIGSASLSTTPHRDSLFSDAAPPTTTTPRSSMMTVFGGVQQQNARGSLIFPHRESVYNPEGDFHSSIRSGMAGGNSLRRATNNMRMSDISMISAFMESWGDLNDSSAVCDYLEEPTS